MTVLPTDWTEAWEQQFRLTCAQDGLCLCVHSGEQTYEVGQMQVGG